MPAVHSLDCLTISSIYVGTSISFSFLDFDSFLTLLSTFRAKLLLPKLFWNTKVRRPLPFKYLEPVTLSPWCWANRRLTSVEIPVYRLPSRHLTKYKTQSDMYVVSKSRTSEPSELADTLVAPALILNGSIIIPSCL